jgi:tetratricopeptide (TPR) repeat protein
LLIFLVLAFSLLSRSWGILQSFALMVMLAPFLIAFLMPLIGSVRRYPRVSQAASWGRWEEVLRLLSTLPKSVPAYSKALRHAEALAGLGRLDEALGVFEPFADNGEIPEWLYWLYRAEIYAVARHGNDVVRAVERAAALAPENSTVLIRCALSLLRFKRDTNRASELLTRARAHAISDLTAPVLEIAEGMLALETGDSVQARKRLESALAELKRLRMGAPLGLVRDLAHAYLAIACAQVGEINMALYHFHRAAPRMRARGWDDLMQRCEHALGDARP